MTESKSQVRVQLWQDPLWQGKQPKMNCFLRKQASSFGLKWTSQKGREEWLFSLFLCNFPRSNSPLHPLVSQTPLQTFSFRNVKTKSKIKQRSASSAFPTAVLLAQSPPASGTNKFTCSYLRELLQLLSPLSCSHRISIICCFFHSIFKYGVSTFLGDSTWSLSFL